MNRKLLLVTATLVGISVLVSGCVALVVGAAGGAGAYIWGQGKLSFTTLHSVRECHAAARSGLKDLEIVITESEVDSLIARVKGMTAVSEPVTVDIEPLTADTTNIDVRVGFWGNETQSRIVADAIRRHLL